MGSPNSNGGVADPTGGKGSAIKPNSAGGTTVSVPNTRQTKGAASGKS